MQTNDECFHIISQEESVEYDSAKDIIYIINSGLQICGYNSAWQDFAQENNGKALLEKEVLNTKLTDHVSGPLKPYYERLYQEILSNKKATSFDYECSSDKNYRVFRQFIYPAFGGKGLILTNHLKIEKTHELNPQHAMSGTVFGSDGSIVQCTNCRKVRDFNDETKWYWMPDIIKTPVQNTSYSICSPCMRYYYSGYFE